jgi:hypothetical protein
MTLSGQWATLINGGWTDGFSACDRGLAYGYGLFETNPTFAGSGAQAVIP